jgi:hypothetical protein
MKEQKADAPTTVHSDAMTILAIGVMAGALATVLHEGGGHGGACVLLGGTPKLLTSTFFTCGSLSGWSVRWLAAAGPITTLIVGLCFLVLLRRSRKLPAAWGYFCWLSMTINLLLAGGYTMVAPFANFGDWALFLHGLQPLFVWKATLTVVGVAISFLGLRLGASEIRPFLGEGDSKSRRREAWRLTLLPYLAGGVLSCAAGARNPGGAQMFLISAVGGLFGTCWLLWLPSWIRPMPSGTGESRVIVRNTLCLVIAAITVVFDIVVLGPGIRLSH